MPPCCLFPSSTAGSELCYKPWSPWPRDQDPQGMQAALTRRNTSLSKTDFRELRIFNRWVKRGEIWQKHGWSLLASSWGFFRTQCPEVSSVGGWFSFCPPVLIPISRTCFFSSWFWALWLFLEERCCPLLVTSSGLQHRKPLMPKGLVTGGNGHGGQGLVQLLDLCEATFKSALLGSPSNAHSLDSSEVIQMGRNWQVLLP